MNTPDQLIFTSVKEKHLEVDATLKHLVKIHNSAKELFILAEELDAEGFSDFLQPVLEIRHSMEHVVRGLYHRLFESYEKDADFDYIRRCYEKALGHEYRCFFDSADWISVRYREKIIKSLKGFDAECIHGAIPNWYSKLNPRAEAINKEIADIRSNKDISKGHQVVDEIEHYQGVLSELTSTYEVIQNSMPSLIELRSKQRRKFAGKIVGAILLAILSATIGSVVTAVSR